MSHHPLAREVTLAVAIKLAIVIGAAFFIFGPSQRPVVDPSHVETRLLGAGQTNLEPRSATP